MGATQPVQGPLLGFRIGYCEGRQAGWEQRGNTMHLYSFCPLAHKQEEAGARLGRVGCSLSMQKHFIAQNHPSSPFAPVPHLPFVLPQGGTEELEESSQCTLPTVPPEGLHSPLGSSLPNAGGHCWRRATTVLDVSQAWSKFALSPPTVVTGIISWVSVPLRLTRYSWLCSFGDVSPSTFFLIPLCTLFCVFAVPFLSHHPCA